MRILFVNSKKAKCSINQSGADIAHILNERFDITYLEETEPANIPLDYDVICTHFHYFANPKINPHTIKHPRLISFNMEIQQNNAFALQSRGFRAHCFPDPTLRESEGVFAFPRPIRRFGNNDDHSCDKPVLGFSGMCTPGKPPEKLAAAIKAEFSTAVVRLALPKATYADPDDVIYNHFVSVLEKELGPNFDIQITREYMSIDDLIQWTAGNDLMIFHYYRNLPGLAATIDQAVAAGVPMSVSSCATFRHVLAYQKPYPELSLIDAMNANTVDTLRQQWSPEKFCDKFQEVLDYVL